MTEYSIDHSRIVEALAFQGSKIPSNNTRISKHVFLIQIFIHIFHEADFSSAIYPSLNKVIHGIIRNRLGIAFHMFPFYKEVGAPVMEFSMDAICLAKITLHMQCLGPSVFFPTLNNKRTLDSAPHEGQKAFSLHWQWWPRMIWCVLSRRQQTLCKCLR